MTAFLITLVVQLGVSFQAEAQSQPLPKDPLLKQTAQCFRSLPVVSQNSRSQMQFYGESVQNKGPNCYPMMLIVRDEKKTQVSVYRDNASGHIEGFHANYSDLSRGEKLGLLLSGKKVGMDYSCRFASKANIAQYGSGESRREVVISPRENPPRLHTGKDFFDGGESWKNLNAKQEHDANELLEMIKEEISVRMSEAGQHSRRLFFRDHVKDLEVCRSLVTEGSKERDQITANKISGLIQTLVGGGDGRGRNGQKGESVR